MRFGVCILTEHRWAEAEPRWRGAEEMGFDHAWTYDHLVWDGLRESPWFGTTPTLAAAAQVTTTIGLGTFVSSPNFRHPYALHRDVQALDDISGGRFLLGVGNGGNVDAEILGQPPMSVRDRVSRFQEFTRLLVRLRREDHVDADGAWFATRGARTLPDLIGVPLLVAANGPRSLRFAAEVGDGWVTTGPRAADLEEWYAGLATARDTLEEALVGHGRDPDSFPRYLHLDSAPRYSLESAELFTEMAGRAGELGFTDVVSAWPRPQPPYAGSVAVLEEVAGLLPDLREAGGTRARAH